MKQLTTAWTRTGKTMALLAFAQSSFNITLCDDPVVFPSGHAERWVKKWKNTKKYTEKRIGGFLNCVMM